MIVMHSEEHAVFTAEYMRTHMTDALTRCSVFVSIHKHSPAEHRFWRRVLALLQGDDDQQEVPE